MKRRLYRHRLLVLSTAVHPNPSGCPVDCLPCRKYQHEQGTGKQGYGPGVSCQGFRFYFFTT